MQPASAKERRAAFDGVRDVAQRLAIAVDERLRRLSQPAGDSARRSGRRAHAAGRVERLAALTHGFEVAEVDRPGVRAHPSQRTKQSAVPTREGAMVLGVAGCATPWRVAPALWRRSPAASGTFAASSERRSSHAGSPDHARPHAGVLADVGREPVRDGRDPRPRGAIRLGRAAAAVRGLRQRLGHRQRALVLYVVEFVADKIPWVDSIWDSVHTVDPTGGRRARRRRARSASRRRRSRPSWRCWAAPLPRAVT